MAEHVNHPAHYNSHPSGVECIEIIRHYVCDIANVMKYLWRAGLKTEEGMSDKDKEREDLHKAVWYLNDYFQSIIGYPQMNVGNFDHPSGHDVEEIAVHYTDAIANTIRLLWRVGMVTIDGRVIHLPGESQAVYVAMKILNDYIATLE